MGTNAKSKNVRAATPDASLSVCVHGLLLKRNRVAQCGGAQSLILSCFSFSGTSPAGSEQGPICQVRAESTRSCQSSFRVAWGANFLTAFLFTARRNLPFNITVDEMYDIFGKYGALRQIRLCVRFSAESPRAPIAAKLFTPSCGVIRRLPTLHKLSLTSPLLSSAQRVQQGHARHGIHRLRRHLRCKERRRSPFGLQRCEPLPHCAVLSGARACIQRRLQEYASARG